MRLLACAVSSLAALALAGCGEDVDVELVWGGPPDAGAGGVVSVNGFATYQESVDEPWERSAVTAAAEFLRLDEREAPRTTVEAESADPEGGGSQTVVVTLAGLLDDALEAERWTLGFEAEDGVYRLTAALREVRCRPERGQRDFAPEPCA